jgi:hypothetical protein
MNKLPTNEPKATSQYMLKYYSDPEYKKRHNTYMMQRVGCVCGATTSRSNATKHRASKQHKLTMDLFRHLTPAEIEQHIAEKNAV